MTKINNQILSMQEKLFDGMKLYMSINMRGIHNLSHEEKSEYAEKFRELVVFSEEMISLARTPEALTEEFLAERTYNVTLVRTVRYTLPVKAYNELNACNRASEMIEADEDLLEETSLYEESELLVESATEADDPFNKSVTAIRENEAVIRAQNAHIRDLIRILES